MANKTTIEIDGKNKGAVIAINGVKQELNQLGNFVGGPFGASMNMLSKHLAFAGVAAGIGALVALTKQAINTADDVSKMSQRVGTSVEFLSTFRYASDLAGTSLETMQGALQRLSRNLFDANRETGDATIVFKELGISTKDSAGKLRDTEDIIYALSDSFKGMEDGSLKTAYAMKVFGKAGADLIPLLNSGSEELKRQQEEARKLGLEISTNFAHQAEVFNDNLTTMSYTLQGVGISIAQELMPFLISLSSALKTYATDTEVASKAGVGFAEVLKAIVTGLGAVYAGATIAGDALGTFYGAVATLFSTGSFTQAAAVVGMGFDTIEKDALKFGKAFDALWTDNTASYQKYMDSIKSGDGIISNAPKNVKALYDAFGHPIDKDGNLTNNLKYIQALIDTQKQLAFDKDSVFATLPSYDMSQYMMVAPDPFANIKFQAIEFFDMYDERSAIMRDMTSDAFGNMAGAADMFFQLGGQKSKAMFALYKTFAIAQATISGYEAVMHSYKEGTKYGGPVLGAIFAATAAAFSVAQIAKIAGAGMGSSGGGSAGGGGGSYGGNVTNPASSGGGGNNQSFVITINGSYWDEDRIARDLIPSLKKAYGDTMGGGN